MRSVLPNFNFVCMYLAKVHTTLTYKCSVSKHCTESKHCSGFKLLGSGEAGTTEQERSQLSRCASLRTPRRTPRHTPGLSVSAYIMLLPHPLPLQLPSIELLLQLLLLQQLQLPQLLPWLQLPRPGIYDQWEQP